jgi:hypothetical protein
MAATVGNDQGTVVLDLVSRKTRPVTFADGVPPGRAESLISTRDAKWWYFILPNTADDIWMVEIDARGRR